MVAWLASDLPEQSGNPRQFAAEDFTVVMGSGRPENGRIIIEEFANGHALLSSGPISVPAQQYRVVRVLLDLTEKSMTATLFWRRSDAAGDLTQRKIGESGQVVIDLAGDPDWRGQVSEFGLLLQTDDEAPISVGAASLEPDSLALRLELTWRGWTAFEGWTQKSINFLQGGRANPSVPLPLVVMAWAAATLLITWLVEVVRRTARSRKMVWPAVLILLAGWMALDVRWTANSLRQSHRMLANWNLDENQRLERGLDGSVFREMKRLKDEVLSRQISRVLLVGDETAIDYMLLRAKYHLLPHSTHVTRRLSAGLKAENLDYVIFLGSPGGIRTVSGWAPELLEELKPVDVRELSTVYEVR
jgi:hypothetical protein